MSATIGTCPRCGRDVVAGELHTYGAVDDDAPLRVWHHECFPWPRRHPARSSGPPAPTDIRPIIGRNFLVKIKWGGMAYTLPAELALAFMEASDNYVAALRLLLQHADAGEVQRRGLDRAADQLAQQLNDEAALRLSAEHALEGVLEMLRSGDVDGATAHVEAVLADRWLGGKEVSHGTAR